MDKVKYTKVPILDAAGKKVWQRIPLQDITEAISLICLAHHIRKGRCGKPQFCVLANMLRERFGPIFHDVCVINTRVLIIMKDPHGELYAIRTGLSSEVERCIRQFDKEESDPGFVVGKEYILPVLVERERTRMRDANSPGGRNTTYNTGKGPQLGKRRSPIRSLSQCVV